MAMDVLFFQLEVNRRVQFYFHGSIIINLIWFIGEVEIVITINVSKENWQDLGKGATSVYLQFLEVLFYLSMDLGIDSECATMKEMSGHIYSRSYFHYFVSDFSLFNFLI